MQRTPGTTSAETLANPLIAARKAILDAVHAKSLRVHGATVLPFGQSTQTYTGSGKATRRKLTTLIRGAAGFDSAIDFDKAIRGPPHPERLRIGQDSGNNLHLSDAGFHVRTCTGL